MKFKSFNYTKNEKMKKIALLLLTAFMVWSCAFTGYTFENKGQTSGVDFRNGSWLLNHIEAPEGVEEKINKKAFEDFQSILKERIHKIQDKKGLLIKNEIPFNPSKTEMENLKKGTGFDYLINLKAKNTKKDFDMIALGNFKNSTQARNIHEIVLEIYDLNNQEIIYVQKVVASSELNENNRGDVHFSMPSNLMVMKGYKKLFKKLKKKSIK